MRAITDLWNYFQNRSWSFEKRGAVSSCEGILTYAGLFEASGNLARQLRSAGIKEGNIIGVALPNSLSFVPTFLALTQMAATTALISAKYGRDELGAISQGIHPQGIITLESHVPTVSAVGDVIEVKTIGGFSWPETLCLVKLRTNEQKVPAQDIAVIKFSSGSTGEPKGMPLTAANIHAECENIIDTLSISERDVIYAPVPLYHSYGFNLGVRR